MFSVMKRLIFDGRFIYRLSRAIKLLRREGLLGLTRAIRSIYILNRNLGHEAKKEQLPHPHEFWKPLEKTLAPPETIVVREMNVSSLEKPQVTIVIPTYGKARFLQDAIFSVSSATSASHECLVIDDGNLDRGALLELERIAVCATHQQLRLIRHLENSGLAQARNTGLDHARGDYIVFLDDDDLLLPASIDAQISEIVTSKADFSIAEYYFYDQEGCSFTWSDSGLGSLKSEVSVKNPILGYWESAVTIPIHSAVFKKSFVERFDEHYRSKEDFDFWLRIFDKGYPAIHNEPAAIYRIHGDQMTAGSRAKHGIYFMEVVFNRSRTLDDSTDEVASALKHVQSYYGKDVINYWAQTSPDRSRWLSLFNGELEVF